MSNIPLERLDTISQGAPEPVYMLSILLGALYQIAPERAAGIEEESYLVLSEIAEGGGGKRPEAEEELVDELVLAFNELAPRALVLQHVKEMSLISASGQFDERGPSRSQVALTPLVVACERVSDRFADVFGTTRGSPSVEPPERQEAAERDECLQIKVENGAVRHYNQEGQLHRETGPAVERNDGTREWYQHGQLHRDNNKPAIEWSNGSRQWYQFGKSHRDDGPADEVKGRKRWYQHGKLHREDGPAMEFADGLRAWYRHGEVHRIDGPAIEWPSGGREWHQYDLHHRDDGPALDLVNGTRKWYQHGVLHRDEGPAVILADGTQQWYRHGKLYREKLARPSQKKQMVPKRAATL